MLITGFFRKLTEQTYKGTYYFKVGLHSVSLIMSDKMDKINLFAVRKWHQQAWKKIPLGTEMRWNLYTVVNRKILHYKAGFFNHKMPTRLCIWWNQIIAHKAKLQDVFLFKAKHWLSRPLRGPHPWCQSASIQVTRSSHGKSRVFLSGISWCCTNYVKETYQDIVFLHKCILYVKITSKWTFTAVTYHCGLHECA